MEKINNNIVNFYEDLWNLRQSVLELGVLTPEEERVVEQNPATSVDAYQNVARLIKQTLKDDDNVIIRENPYNLLVTTKNIEGIELPIIAVTNKNTRENTNIDLYQTEFNRDKRQDYIDELYNYFIELMNNHGDVTTVLEELDAVVNRPNISQSGKFELMSIQLDYRARILNTLKVSPKEYFEDVIPHSYALGKSLTRRRMGTKLTDTYQIY